MQNQSSLAQRELRRTVLSLALGLLLLVVAVKVVLLPFPVQTAGELVRWVLRLAVVAAPDVCFVVALATVCLLVSNLVAGSAAVRRCWRVALFLLFYTAGVYAIASVPMYRVTKVPLTLPLLSYAGGPVLMASSLRSLISLPTVIALTVIPPLLLISPRLLRRMQDRLRPLSVSGRRWLSAAVVLLATCYGAVCHAYVASHWKDPNRWERRIAQSPHAVLLGSCLREWIKDRPLTLTTAFADADQRDFLNPLENRLPPSSQPGRQSWQPAESNRPRNVILIVLESTGIEYLGLYGSSYPTTPNLERLAAQQGVVFDNFYVQSPNSCKSLIALTAGVVPRLDWRLIVRDCPDFRAPTMAEILHDSGYRTCFLHSGYWSWKNRDRYLSARGGPTLIDAARLAGEEVNSWGVSDRAMYGAALDWIDQHPAQPQFVFAYTIETHHPYVTPPRPRQFDTDDEELNRYLNAVRAADENIGWLMQELQRRGLAESTLVAVTADHGESFGQHGQRVHSFGIYEQDVHVPLVLLHPSLADAPKRVATLGQHIDLPATILGMVDVPAPAEWQGRNLFTAPPAARAYFFATGNEIVLGLREGRLKYHYYVQSDREELFDLIADPDERHNLAVAHAEKCRQFRRRVGGLVEYQRRRLAELGAP